jgi:GNAT superfamily N-acetyltransferase
VPDPPALPHGLQARPAAGYGDVFDGREAFGMVDPGWRGRGIGAWLLRRIERMARERRDDRTRGDRTLEVSAPHADRAFRQLAQREGYRQGRSSWPSSPSAATGEGWAWRSCGTGSRSCTGRGERQVWVYVDTENRTGATRLYERAGMRVEHRLDFWVKHLG